MSYNRHQKASGKTLSSCIGREMVSNFFCELRTRCSGHDSVDCAAYAPADTVSSAFSHAAPQARVIVIDHGVDAVDLYGSAAMFAKTLLELQSAHVPVATHPESEERVKVEQERKSAE